MKAEEYIRAGRLEEALAELQNAVRNKPEDSRLRTFLFQLQCVLGRWDKALTQLQVLEQLNAETMLLAQLFRPVINCETLRAEIFEGKRTPIIFGEPMEWVGLLVKANEHVARGEFVAAQNLRDQAFEAAPATPGTLDGKPFEWIADADSRLGPMLEVILEGRYVWVPFCRITRIHIEKPADLRDLVWAPAQFVWSNGGEASGHIPGRYPGTEKSADGALRLARKTEWVENAGDVCLGLGQRILVTESGDHPLFECSTIDLTQPK
ncbi:MAG: virulence protein SciE type [Pedosphaera sp.]|nr:virulence protein SciE type [Pedosphaera sp.]